MWRTKGVQSCAPGSPRAVVLESLRAMEELVNEAGGIIVGKMAVLAEGDANDRPDITVLGKLPLFNPDGTPKA